MRLRKKEGAERTIKHSGAVSDIGESNIRGYRIPNNIDGMIIESKSIHATIKYIEQDGVVALVNILSRMELQRTGEEDTFAANA